MTSKQLCSVLALSAAALLAGCGGGGGGDEGMTGNGQGNGDSLAQVPSSASQSSSGLMAYLKALVAIASEDREPFGLDGTSPPKDEASEPEVVG